MKVRGLGITILVLSALLFLTPWALFPVCGGAKAVFSGSLALAHACVRTARAEMALGLIGIVVAMVPLLWPSRNSGLFGTISSLVLALFIVLFPTALTGLCKVPTMACRVGTWPALVTLALLFGLTSLVGLFLARAKT